MKALVSITIHLFVVFIDLKRHFILWITVFLLPNLTTTELGVLPTNG